MLSPSVYAQAVVDAIMILGLGQTVANLAKDRALLFGVLGTLLAVSILVYLWGRFVLRDEWPELWMPAFIATWTGFIVAFPILEFILDNQRRREHERELAPHRQKAANELSFALRGILIWAVETSSEPPEEPVKAAEFFSVWAKDVRWQGWALHPAQIRQFPVVLRETGERLAEFRERYGLLFAFEEVEQMSQLERYARDPVLPRTIDGVANTVERSPADFGSVEPLRRICVRTSELFNPVANMYTAMARSPLMTPTSAETISYVRPWDRLLPDKYEALVPDRVAEILRRNGNPDFATKGQRRRALVQALREANQLRQAGVAVPPSTPTDGRAA